MGDISTLIVICGVYEGHVGDVSTLIVIIVIQMPTTFMVSVNAGLAGTGISNISTKPSQIYPMFRRTLL